MSTGSRSARYGEAGSIIPLLAIALPVFTLLLVFVVDVGHWLEHRRHLQLQVDAGALAAGGVFQNCFNGLGSTPIEDTARTYAGATGTPVAPGPTIYNQQVNNRSNVHVLVNSTDYWASSWSTEFDDGGHPCTTSFIDLKATDANVPWFFKFGGSVVSSIKAHARVKLVQETSKTGTIPVAVPDPGTITGAAVELIDEETQTVLGSAPLTSSAPSGGFVTWQGTLPSPVNIGSSRYLGVRVKLTGQTPAPGTIDCGAIGVQCYDAGTIPAAPASPVPTRGILFARGFPSSGIGDGAGAPVVRSLTLSTASCTDAYFNGGACTVLVSADATFASIADNKITFTATATDEASTGGNYSDTNELKHLSGTTWASIGNGQFKYFTLPAEMGAIDFRLGWKQTDGVVNGTPCTSSAPCSGNWGNVLFQRGFTRADWLSGPIRLIQLWEGGAQTTGSFAQGSSHTFTVKLQVPTALANAAGVSDPKIYLRVLGGQSQNQTIDCDPGYPNVRDELANGCRPEYKVNDLGNTCPSPYDYSSLTSQPQPWPCARVQTGGSIGQESQGMDDRILQAGTCAQHSNNWSSSWTTDSSGKPVFRPPAGDTRLISVILTQFGAFGGSGNTAVPVTGFAEFYVTGWGHNGSSQGCSGDDTVPGAGWVVGHFVKYVDSVNTGGGTQTCNTSALGTCVPVLVQ
jgi:Putative Flp pilus-assembly TadE/G-like